VSGGALNPTPTPSDCYHVWLLCADMKYSVIVMSSWHCFHCCGLGLFMILYLLCRFAMMQSTEKNTCISQCHVPLFDYVSYLCTCYFGILKVVCQSQVFSAYAR